MATKGGVLEPEPELRLDSLTMALRKSAMREGLGPGQVRISTPNHDYQLSADPELARSKSAVYDLTMPVLAVRRWKKHTEMKRKRRERASTRTSVFPSVSLQPVEPHEQRESRSKLALEALYNYAPVILGTLFMFAMLFIAKDDVHEYHDPLGEAVAVGLGAPAVHPVAPGALNVVEVHVVAPGLEAVQLHRHHQSHGDVEEHSGHYEKEELRITFHVALEQRLVNATDSWTVLSLKKLKLDQQSTSRFFSFRVKKLSGYVGSCSEADGAGCEAGRLPLRVSTTLAQDETVGIASDGSETMLSHGHSPVVVKVEVHQLGIMGDAQVPVALCILLSVLGLIAAEAIHRTLAAFGGAAVTLFVLLLAGRPPSVSTVVEWVDEGALMLLFGMMIIIGKLSTTGFFEVICVQVVQLSGPSKFRLLTILCLTTALLSAFLDNVTTVLLIVPVTIHLCEVLCIDPIPYLLAETLFSNIGGTGTMIGDPPNIIIGNQMQAEGIGFVDFIVNLMPGVLIALGPCLFLLKLVYKDQVAGKLVHYQNALDLREHFKIKTVLCNQTGFLLMFVVLAFCTHPVHHINPAWISIFGALVLMITTAPHEIHEDLMHVEWDMLLFFAGLFVMVEGLAELGLIRAIGDVLTEVIAAVPEASRGKIAIVLIMYASALISGFLDNIPYTATLVPVIKQLAADETLGLKLEPLTWALAFGACLGGNGSLVGASANIVMAGLVKSHYRVHSEGVGTDPMPPDGHSIGVGTDPMPPVDGEKPGSPPEGGEEVRHRPSEEGITFIDFLKVGFPTMLVSVTVACIYMLLVWEL